MITIYNNQTFIFPHHFTIRDYNIQFDVKLFYKCVSGRKVFVKHRIVNKITKLDNPEELKPLILKEGLTRVATKAKKKVGKLYPESLEDQIKIDKFINYIQTL